jgi:hypothetical protein
MQILRQYANALVFQNRAPTSVFMVEIYIVNVKISGPDSGFATGFPLLKMRLGVSIVCKFHTPLEIEIKQNSDSL